MDPIIIPILIVAAIAVAAGKKKKGKRPPGELEPGPERDTPTPKVPGAPDRGSDPLPGGTKDGYLPKGEGYGEIIPDGLTTEDLWISPDCQAYLIGADWYPVAADPEEGAVLLDAYQWFVARPRFSYDDAAYAAIDRGEIKAGYEAGMFPEYSTLDEFALAVLFELSPECARTMPLWGDYDTFDDWAADYHEWAESYPILDKLFALIKAEAAEGTAYEDVNVYEACGGPPEEYVGARNMAQAYSDKIPETALDCIEFEPTG